MTDTWGRQRTGEGLWGGVGRKPELVPEVAGELGGECLCVTFRELLDGENGAHASLVGSRSWRINPLLL